MTEQTQPATELEPTATSESEPASATTETTPAEPAKAAKAAEATQAAEPTEPADVRAFPAEGFGAAFEIIPGLGLQAIPAPGHTEGSTLFFFNAPLADNYLLTEAEVLDDDPSHADEEHDYLMALAGDVIFKGSVGRTDLPGGDQVQMWATLRLLASAVSPQTVLLPGHGAVTTMEHEHHGNPYLAEAKIRGGDRNA